MKPNRNWIIRTIVFYSLFLGGGLYIVEMSFPKSSVASEAGWTLFLSKTGDWRQVEGKGSLALQSDKLTAYLDANSSSTWVLTIEPIWVYRYSVLSLKYRMHGIVNDASHPFLQLQPGSTGPVTPGATNLENPFARSGSLPIAFASESSSDSQIHEVTRCVFPPIRTEQIDRLVLSLQSGNQPAVFELLELSFFEPEEKSRPVLSLHNLQPLDSTQSIQEMSPFLLPEGTLSLPELTGRDFDTSSEIGCMQIPFRIHPSGRILATSMAYRGALTLNLNRSCRDLFLLMGCDLVGTDSAFRFTPRVQIVQPERLIVKLRYGDGTEDRVFPYNLNRSDFVVDASAVCCYAIPCHPQKEIETVRIEETMSYGRLFLLAATLGTSATTAVPTDRLDFPRNIPLSPIASEIHSSTMVIDRDRYIRFENALYKIELDAKDACRITALTHKKISRELLHRPDSLFSLQVGGSLVTPEQMIFDRYSADRQALHLYYTLHADTGDLLAQVTIQSETPSECMFSLRLTNPGYRPQSIRLRFPSLSGIQISDTIRDDYYLFPRRCADWSNTPVVLQAVHSGEFPLQFMDLYSQSSAGGLALHTRDSRLILKQFRLEKTDTESRMGVDYGFDRPIELKPQQEFQTPPTALQFHDGDWHAPFHTYREWCKSWYRPNPNTRAIFQNVFLCRRDYPIGGTGYLMDAQTHRYTFPRLLEESREDLGGADLIDISGWAYSEKYGRVGEYERYELGGLKNLQEGIAQSHSLGVPVGLYLEGYLIDPRSQIGRMHGKEWQIVDAQGKPKQWPGNEEMFICPSVPAWQDFMSHTLLHVARDTGADGVYMDEYGFADSGKTCFASQHGHLPGLHPVLSEHSMLQTVRAKLDECERPIALYLEQTPNDVSSQYVDAAFEYAFFDRSVPGSPAKLNLFRFAFPSLKIIQLFHAGIDPRSASEEDAKLCFFYGEAMWLKGRARSWYSRECRALIQKAYGISHEYKDLFTSSDVEPMIPTEQVGLFANRFSSDRKSIVTLYNATPFTLRGPLLQIPTHDLAVTNLWDEDPFPFESTDRETSIRGTLYPHAVACLLLESSQSGSR